MKTRFSFRQNPADSLCFRSFFLLCGIAMAVSEIWKQFYLTFALNGGQYDFWYFPFQLCSIPMYLLLFLPYLRPGKIRRALLTFLMCYSLLSGIIVFADTNGMHYPVLSLTLHSYLWHLLLIVIGIAAGICCIKEQPRGESFSFNFLSATILYLFCCCIATVLNNCFFSYGPINMFYINFHLRMSQVVFSDFVSRIGNTPAIFLYIAATIGGAYLLFFVWSVLYRLFGNSIKKSDRRIFFRQRYK